MPGYWHCTVSGTSLGSFVSPIDLSGGLVSCEYVTGPDWVTRFGPWAAKGAIDYGKWLARLLEFLP